MNEELVKLAQKGDNEAFYRLVSEESQKLYNIAFHYFKNEADTLEAIQEITCRAFVKLKKLKEPQFFSTWITRILINYCIDEQKKNKKFIHLEESISSKSNIAETSLDSVLLEIAMNELKPKYKKVIILKYYQDMTIEEISKVLHCPEGTVKTWTYRAINQLRLLLNKEDYFNV